MDRESGDVSVRLNQTSSVPDAPTESRRDHESTDLCPQDGNSLALAYDLAAGDRASRVSEGLTKNWNDIGPVTPELADTISPFISSIEVSHV